MKKGVMILFATLGLLILFCVCTLVTGVVSLEMNGFAVDKDGYLYVGKSRRISVFKGGVCIRTIDVPTSRSYKFTIVDGENILLSTGTKKYEMNLAGKVLSESLDEGTKVYNQLQWKKCFVDENGVEYLLKFPWGRTCIFCNGIVIYQMPTFDYVIRILLIVLSVTLVLSVGIFIKNMRF